MQTVFPRLLGPLSTWKEMLKSQTDLGYNAFHFAPVQKLGSSGSLYSIKNQQKLSKEIRLGKNVNFLRFSHYKFYS
jgi:glycogen debranching enzyme